MQKLNLGCGKRLASGWINVDFYSNDKSVIKHDLRQDLPFESRKFDIVYHSHVLEHLSPDDASKLIRECYRVLKPGGILRVVVPDLEELAAHYLNCLNELKLDSTNPDKLIKHEWSVVELIDQLTRTKSGGKMVEFIYNHSSQSHLEFIRSRLGSELSDIISDLNRTSPAINNPTNKPSHVIHGLVYAIKQRTKAIWRLIKHNHHREALDPFSGSSNDREPGFYNSGELHRWMYDSASLSNLLAANGFVEVNKVNAHESRAEYWCIDNLDIDPDGSMYKPNSLIVEALKPGP